MTTKDKAPVIDMNEDEFEPETQTDTFDTMPFEKTEHRTLKYEYTQEEMNELSKNLAENTKKLVAVKEEKQSVVSQYTARVKEVEAKNNTLSNQIYDGWEHRDVQCEIQYHKPVEGKKLVKRLDTLQEWEEKMESWEFNLFTQPGLED